MSLLLEDVKEHGSSVLGLVEEDVVRSDDRAVVTSTHLPELDIDIVTEWELPIHS